MSLSKRGQMYERNLSLIANWNGIYTFKILNTAIWGSLVWRSWSVTDMGSNKKGIIKNAKDSIRRGDWRNEIMSNCSVEVAAERTVTPYTGKERRIEQ